MYWQKPSCTSTGSEPTVGKAHVNFSLASAPAQVLPVKSGSEGVWSRWARPGHAHSVTLLSSNCNQDEGPERISLANSALCYFNLLY
ncbi:unnamed protein product [Coffea canephora]|uniref:Uncharacterized protein n=1 Tax=Coffea canephora TaxID=49390 RepID=A0A068TM44_COFCA|nr:unnamed protein product [Coffea canephora]